MNDMSSVIVPKSDQLNADDLLARPITIKISAVKITGGEQPCSIFYEGDGGKPWKCCKSMARVLVHLWGPDANRYVGRSVTLYADPTVKWGGMAVGGIRISHMSDIDKVATLMLTATKGSRKPFVVQPIVKAEKKNVAQDAAEKPAVPATPQAEVKVEDSPATPIDDQASYALVDSHGEVKEFDDHVTASRALCGLLKGADDTARAGIWESNEMFRDQLPPEALSKLVAFYEKLGASQ